MNNSSCVRIVDLINYNISPKYALEEISKMCNVLVEDILFHKYALLYCKIEKDGLVFIKRIC